MKIDRLLAILYILSQKNRVTAKTLSDHFEVSQRTIYRDIDSLCLGGFAIQTEPGPHGGISLMDQNIFEGAYFSPEDQALLYASIEGLSSLFSTGKKDLLKPKSQAISLSFHEKLSDEQKTNLQTLFINIQGSLTVQFNYRSATGDESHRTVYPLKLHLSGSQWYLQSWCLTKKEYRTFKLNRMKRISSLNESFSPKEYLKDLPPLNQHSGKIPEKIEVLLLSPIPPGLPFFSEKTFAQSTKQGDIHHLYWPIDPWVLSYFLSLGSRVRVKSPIFLVNQIQKELKKSLILYNC